MMLRFSGAFKMEASTSDTRVHAIFWAHIRCESWITSITLGNLTGKGRGLSARLPHTVRADGDRSRSSQNQTRCKCLQKI